MKPILLTLLASFSLAFAESPWIPLFNGKDLSGWTPKICKHPLGENFANTYRVESAEALTKAGAPKILSYGHIALQAEGQPVWFRNIELKSLEPES